MSANSQFFRLSNGGALATRIASRTLQHALRERRGSSKQVTRCYSLRTRQRCDCRGTSSAIAVAWRRCLNVSRARCERSLLCRVSTSDGRQSVFRFAVCGVSLFSDCVCLCGVRFVELSTVCLIRSKQRGHPFSAATATMARGQFMLATFVTICSVIATAAGTYAHRESHLRFTRSAAALASVRQIWLWLRRGSSGV